MQAMLSRFKQEIVGEVTANISRKIEEEWRQKFEDLEGENMQLRRRIEDLEKKNEEAEKRERKKNIIIKGTKDRIGSPREIVEAVFREVGGMNEEANVKEVIKLGKGENNILLVKMENFEEKMKIMSKRGNLKGKNVYLDDDMTFKERERQKKIRDWAKRERERGHRVNVGYGKGYLDGIEYVWNEENERMQKKFGVEAMHVR